jgi:hypothetical protein
MNAIHNVGRISKISRDIRVSANHSVGRVSSVRG